MAICSITVVRLPKENRIILLLRSAVNLIF
nr:MAG TPA: hypothetical protein [Caudoviricetes sp.]